MMRSLNSRNGSIGSDDPWIFSTVEVKPPHFIDWIPQIKSIIIVT
jgi:hypothetical protein